MNNKHNLCLQKYTITQSGCTVYPGITYLIFEIMGIFWYIVIFFIIVVKLMDIYSIRRNDDIY